MEFGKEVGVADAKSLEDVYKSHLENTSEWALSSVLTVMTMALLNKEGGRILLQSGRRRGHT